MSPSRDAEVRRRLSPEEEHKIRRRLHALGRMMDEAVEIPGTRFRVGLDPVLGLVPGAGDAVSMFVSIYIVYEARRLGVSKGTLLRMLGNVAIDAAVGSVPLLGDVADAFIKANRWNLKMLGIDVTSPLPPERLDIVDPVAGDAPSEVMDAPPARRVRPATT